MSKKLELSKDQRLVSELHYFKPRSINRFRNPVSTRTVQFNADRKYKIYTEYECKLRYIHNEPKTDTQILKRQGSINVNNTKISKSTINNVSTGEEGCHSTNQDPNTSFLVAKIIIGANVNHIYLTIIISII